MRVCLLLCGLGLSFAQAALLPADLIDTSSQAHMPESKEPSEPAKQDSHTKSQAISFEQAYSLLLETSQAIKAQDLSVDRAKKLALGAKLSFLPEINASVFYTHLDRKIQEQLPMDTSSIPQPCPSSSRLYLARLISQLSYLIKISS